MTGSNTVPSLEAFGLRMQCPVERVTTMVFQPSGPAGLRWRCRQCRVVVVMPRAALYRALRAKGRL